MSRVDIHSYPSGLDIDVARSLAGSSRWAKQRLAYEQMRPLLDLMPSKLALIKERRLARENGDDNWIRNRIDEDLLAMLLADEQRSESSDAEKGAAGSGEVV